MCSYGINNLGQAEKAPVGSGYMKAVVIVTRLARPGSEIFHQSHRIFFLRRKHEIAERIKQCTGLRGLESMHAKMIKTNQNEDCFLMNQLISAITAFREIRYAVSAFTQMQEPNVFVYNALIRGLLLCSCPIQALEHYKLMLRDSVTPSSFTFSSLIKACRILSAQGFGESIHGQIWRSGYASHLYVQTGLIGFYSNADRLLQAQKLFEEMPERDIFSWTTMVSGLARIGDLLSARELFNKMPEKNIATWNCMIDGYGRRGDVGSAEALFHQMPERDTISWTAMIACYSQNKRFAEALSVFNQMAKNGISPDEVTISTIISACAHLGALELGTELHQYVIENGFDLDVYIGSALVDMYAKCGSIAKSLVVFLKLREKNLFCWNSIIEALAAHGYADSALKMFDEMVKNDVKPNAVTFVSVLSACTHAGLVDEGKRRFKSMVLEHCIEPEIEHYGCIVDLLSRAGLLQEALQTIENMNLKANSVIWGALLGGCRIHKSWEIAKVASKELAALEPENSGFYAAMVNIYAEEESWSDVAEVRARMRELGVEKKCPGSSWIEMGRKVHQFGASDRSHSLSDEVYLMLDELYVQMKLRHMACVPQLGCL